jgi:molybdopterin-containing oxidoreductase family iron-sulfur binding subunit
MAQRKFGMVIDLERCLGCCSCVVACKVENNVPMGMTWNRVLTRGGDKLDTAGGIFPNVEMEWLPLKLKRICV